LKAGQQTLAHPPGLGDFGIISYTRCTSAEALHDAMAWLSALTVGQAQAAFGALREEVSATLLQDSQDVIVGAARAMSATSSLARHTGTRCNGLRTCSLAADA
jgi:hypothetical protein